MMNSEQLAELTQQYQQQGGEIETSPIAQRDFSSPNGKWMMASANDAPKMHKDHARRIHKYAANCHRHKAKR